MRKLLYFLVIITILLCNTVFLSGCAKSNNKPTATETTNSTTASTAKTEATTVNSSGEITKDKAEDIALKDAGFNAENVTVKSVTKDVENGKEVYEVEFEADNYEYDYLIDVATGAVTQATREHKDNTATDSASNSSDAVTLDEAKKIAINHAGTPEGSVTFTKTKMDTDDGIKIYEIDFTAGNVEYEYDINADTGEIISSDKDTEKISATTADSQTSVLIPSSQAVRIALVDAGVKEKDATIDPVDLDAENGVQYYDVKFRAGNIEYEYDIDAQTGEILSSDKD